MGQSNSPSENYLFLNVMVNFVIVNQKLTGSALHIEKNQTIPYRVCFVSFSSDLGSMPGGGARGQNLGHLENVLFT